MKIACRPGCGACCIAISISSPIPGLPYGKPAGMPCPHLTPQDTCGIWRKPGFPDICRRFQATDDLCGRNTTEALYNIGVLERETTP